MRGLEPLAEHAKSALARKGLWPAGIELVARADLDMDGNFAEVWVVVTKESLHVIQGPAIPMEDLLKEKPKKKLVPDVGSWSDTEYKSFELSKVTKCSMESMTGSGVFVITIDESDVAVCRFSNTMSYKFGKLARIVDKMREGKELEDKDFEDDRNETVCPKCGKPYPEQNRMVCPKCLDRRTLFKRVLSFVPRYRSQIVLILLCMM